MTDEEIKEEGYYLNVGVGSTYHKACAENEGKKFDFDKHFTPIEEDKEEPLKAYLEYCDIMTAEDGNQATVKED